MKAILFLCLFLCTTSNDAVAQTRQINKFYHKHRNDKGVINVTIPGLFIRWGGKIARKHIKDDPAALAALKMVKKIKGIRMIVVEEENDFPMVDYNKMVSKLKKNRGFEDMILIRSEGTQVNVMAQGKNDKLKNLLFLVNDEDCFVMFSMKTKMKMKDFSKLINEIIRAQKQQDKEDKEQEKKRVPQA